MSTPYVMVLTGSIGTGKSTTAAMFADLGVPIWDADAAVARLYAKGGKAVTAVEHLAPDAIIDGMVDKARLREAIGQNPQLLPKIEAVVHPLVADDREVFLEENRDADLVLLDIPLYFETSSKLSPDGVLVVTIDPEEQKRRVLARGTMTEAQFNLILSRQMPDPEKREMADFVIETREIEQTRKAVQKLVSDIRSR